MSKIKTEATVTNIIKCLKVIEDKGFGDWPVLIASEDGTYMKKILSIAGNEVDGQRVVMLIPVSHKNIKLVQEIEDINNLSETTA